EVLGDRIPVARDQEPPAVSENRRARAARALVDDESRDHEDEEREGAEQILVSRAPGDAARPPLSCRDGRRPEGRLPHAARFYPPTRSSAKRAAACRSR